MGEIGRPVTGAMLAVSSPDSLVVDHPDRVGTGTPPRRARRRCLRRTAEARPTTVDRAS